MPLGRKPEQIFTWRILLTHPGLMSGFSDPMAGLSVFWHPGVFFFQEADLCQGIWGKRELWILVKV